MLAVVFCLAGVFGLLLLGEKLASAKILKGENLRKFVHISVGSFVAFWPWLVSWRTIQLLGVAMLAVVLLNRGKANFFHIHKGVKRETYGDIFFAIAIIICALLTDSKVFFALAMLELALADGIASAVGIKFGMAWRYKVYKSTKTVIGTMTFWLISLCIFATGLLFAHDVVDYGHYALVLLLLPPVLTLLENVSLLGLDDLVIPVAVILALQLVQTN